jgi:uncharacterized membrane protein YdjX (TVP38/TMEM64 family)
MGTVTATLRRYWTKRRLLLTAGGAILAVTLVLVAMKLGLRTALHEVVLGLREAGPLVFFVAMAVLPAVGFPMMFFTLSAGSVFAPEFGTGWVIAWSLTAVVVNLLLTYWLADRALRPLMSRLMAWLDFRLPRVPAGGAWPLTVIVRLTPGPPYWAQSYLLGLMRVPLVPYFTVSVLVMAGYIVALVYGGEAITEGKGGQAVAAAGLLAVVIAVLQLFRRRTLRRQAEAAPTTGNP